MSNNVSPSKDFLAGTVSGIAGIIAGHPLDTVKVRIQTQPTIYNRGTFPALFKILSNEKIHGLYKGVTTPLAGVGVLSAMCFGIYGNSLRGLESFRGIPRSKTEYYTDVFLAGCVSGTVVCLLQAPSDLIKIRLQLQENMQQKMYDGPIDCAKKVYKAEGIRGLCRGMVPTILRDAGPGYGIYFLAYEVLKDSLGNGALGLLAAGGSAGVLSWITSYPFDVVKTRLQSVHTAHHYNGFWHCVKKSYHEEGYRVFFRGIGSCLIRSFPVNAITFFVYQRIMEI